MRTAKGLKPPPYMASLLPLLAIAALSFFVVWQWVAQVALNATHSRESMEHRASSTKSLPNTNAGATMHPVFPDPDPLARTQDLTHEVPRCCDCETADEVKQAKTASLLHNWTDHELYGRVIAAELKRGSKKNPSGKEIACAKIDDGWPGRSMRHRLRSGSTESCNTFCARNNDSGPVPDAAVAGGKVKIAFLFMITTSLPFEPLWNEFFEGKEGLYNVYVHADPFDPHLFSETSRVFYNRLIPSQKAYRGSPSLVMASNRLIANAMLDDPANAYFALLSGQCIPIRSFAHVYQVVTSSRQSFLEQIVNETVMWERYTGREGGEDVMLPEITFDQFRKAAQWFVYLRRHSLMILQDVHKKGYWSHFDRECVIYFCGTDEHYYPTFFNIVDPDRITGTSLTYVEWPDYVSEHPVTFHQQDISRELITNIQMKNDGQYSFARKMETDTVDLLMTMTDTILSYYKHYKLYQYAFTPNCIVDLEQISNDDVVELPLPIPSLREAKTQDERDADLLNLQLELEEIERKICQSEVLVREAAIAASIEAAYRAAIPEEVTQAAAAAVTKHMEKMRADIEEKLQATEDKIAGKIRSSPDLKASNSVETPAGKNDKKAGGKNPSQEKSKDEKKPSKGK